jgi:hypothetical protein
MAGEGSQGASTGGIGFLGLLTVLFIGLKLTHYIDWSWKWVLAPLWIPLAVAAVLFVLYLLLGLLSYLLRRW